jgi:murein DD-endopeptidase MepM/ murein hydrolase activator NlpD
VRAVVTSGALALAALLLLAGGGLLLGTALLGIRGATPPSRQAQADIPATVLHDIGGLGQSGDPFARACRPVVTQPYGPTTFASEPIIGGQHFHTGIDLACPEGTPVHSLTDGVAHVTLGFGGGYGNNVVVEVETRLPGDLVAQRYFIRYAHLDVVTVADGAVVHGGDLVGLEGSTGNSTGPHLHFEIDRGAAAAVSSINPSPLLELS